MTKEDLIIKIQEKCDSETHGWWIFKWKSTFKLTKTEPYFTVQIPEQLPEEYSTLSVLKPHVILNKEGVFTRGQQYHWPDIIVTALLNDRARGLYLIIGLNNGNLVEGLIGEISSEAAGEFGHMVEMYKRNAKKN